ncbi:hypothetical protein Tco_0297517 [Tanacetum coccineum]
MHPCSGAAIKAKRTLWVVQKPNTPFWGWLVAGQWWGWRLFGGGDVVRGNGRCGGRGGVMRMWQRGWRRGDDGDNKVLWWAAAEVGGRNGWPAVAAGGGGGAWRRVDMGIG